MSTFFSIVVPTYNRATFIKKTLLSLLEQNYREFEIIVVDDGSTDNTEEVVNSLGSGRVLYHKKTNEERAAARNAGARLAKGDYVNFFDSDDLAYPNHLSTAIDLIKTHDHPEFFHLGYDIKDVSGRLLKKADSFSGDLGAALIKGNLLSCNGVFIRRDIALKYPFNTDRELSATEDYELWLRLCSRFELFYSNTITSSVINHDERSVLQINRDKLLRRQELFLKYIWEDEEVRNRFEKYRSFVRSETFTYIALHLALTKKYRKDVLRYLGRSFLAYPAVLGRRRFWASLKHLM